MGLCKRGTLHQEPGSILVGRCYPYPNFFTPIAFCAVLANQLNDKLDTDLAYPCHGFSTSENSAD